MGIVEELGISPSKLVPDVVIESDSVITWSRHASRTTMLVRLHSEKLYDFVGTQWKRINKSK